jgi:hypothetical protein
MAESYNPWTIVNVVFGHLVEQGMQPVLGETGDPGEAAGSLLRALGIQPAVDATGKVGEQTREELAALRAVFDEVE